jgi:hypothetical protein
MASKVLDSSVIMNSTIITGTEPDIDHKDGEIEEDWDRLVDSDEDLKAEEID